MMSPNRLVSSATRFSIGSSGWSDRPMMKRMTMPSSSSSCCSALPVGTHVLRSRSLCALELKPVLMAMTARYLGGVSAPRATACRLEEALPPVSAFRQGCRMCSSSHSCDTWALRTRIMVSLRASAWCAWGCWVASMNGNGDWFSSLLPLPESSGMVKKARTSWRPGGSGGRAWRHPSSALAVPSLSLVSPSHSRLISKCGVGAPPAAVPTFTPSTYTVTWTRWVGAFRRHAQPVAAPASTPSMAPSRSAYLLPSLPGRSASSS
mmetsp:Transcript_13969/g.42128  ORF Transcript_13969/g.42128 Transcript_13969/m.42128 type:complete len:264 (+) Transcript_13969:2008-2799(+)